MRFRTSNLMPPVISGERGACWITIKLGTSLIHPDSALVQQYAVQRSDSSFSMGWVSHFDEGETTGIPGVTIFDNRHAIHWSVGRKQITQLLFCSA